MSQQPSVWSKQEGLSPRTRLPALLLCAWYLVFISLVQHSTLLWNTFFYFFYFFFKQDLSVLSYFYNWLFTSAWLRCNVFKPNWKLSPVAGCKLGEASEFLVHMEARIQVPVRSGQVGCYEVCTCGQSSRLENCAEMPCIDTTKTCTVGGQRKSETWQTRYILTFIILMFCFVYSDHDISSNPEILSRWWMFSEKWVCNC